MPTDLAVFSHVRLFAAEHAVAIDDVLVMYAYGALCLALDNAGDIIGVTRTTTH